MATHNFHDNGAGDGHIAKGPAMVHDNPMDTVNAEIDNISGFPDDVLLDILGRLVMAGDVHSVARTSILSRRWRSLPWPQIPNVFLDVGRFVHSDDEWQRVRRRRQRFWEQHHATVGFTDALARFLAAPPSERVIESLSLKFILMKRDYVRRIGELVGCPGAFRSLTKLTLQDLWFDDPDELNNNLLRVCNALQLLSLSSCALLPAMNEDEPSRPPALTIDAPQSQLQILRCDLCHIGGVELVQAPALAGIRYRAIVLGDSPPITFGCTPSLKGLCLGHYEDENSFVKLKLSELLVNGGGQLECLILAFENGKIWLQPERPKQLRAALRGLKHLTLKDLPPECNLSWATFLLEAALFLETLDIHISSHICLDSWHKGDEDASLAWEPSPDFRHHHLKQLSFKRAFHVEKDLPFARVVMGLAVNLQAVTLGVKLLGCTGCIGALPKYPDLARSRLRFADGSGYVDAFMKELMDGITTSAKITLLLSYLV